MPGGKRPGAGRKSGAAWAGANPRPAPLRDMARTRVREVLTTAQDPLSVLCELASDAGQDVQLRVQAATAACPYLYPRLSQSVVATFSANSKEPAAAIVDRLLNRLERMVPAVATVEAEPVAA